MSWSVKGDQSQIRDCCDAHSTSATVTSDIFAMSAQCQLVASGLNWSTQHFILKRKDAPRTGITKTENRLLLRSSPRTGITKTAP